MAIDLLPHDPINLNSEIRKHHTECVNKILDQWNLVELGCRNLTIALLVQRTIKVLACLKMISGVGPIPVDQYIIA